MGLTKEQVEQHIANVDRRLTSAEEVCVGCHGWLSSAPVLVLISTCSCRGWLDY